MKIKKHEKKLVSLGENPKYPNPIWNLLNENEKEIRC